MSRKTTILEVKRLTGAPVTVAPNGPCHRCGGVINGGASKIAVVTVNRASGEITLKWGFFCGDCAERVAAVLRGGGALSLIFTFFKRLIKRVQNV